MSLRSGRVGVNPEDVNPINGKIQVAVPDNVYTKTQADNKFETKTHAGNTYLTKTEAEALQPINLTVPVPLLDGSALTVESGLQGLSEDMKDALTIKRFTKTYNLNGQAGDITALESAGVVTLYSTQFVVSSPSGTVEIDLLDFADFLPAYLFETSGAVNNSNDYPVAIRIANNKLYLYMGNAWTSGVESVHFKFAMTYVK